MRKIANWFKITFTDAKTALYAGFAVNLTSAILLYGDNNNIKAVVGTLGVENERLKVMSILTKLLPDFEAAKTDAGRKALAARIGAEIIRDLSGGKGKFSKYVEIFELFLAK